MNAARRKAIAAAVAQLDALDAARSELVDAITALRDEEDGALQALPDSLREGTRGEAMQEAVDALDEALSVLDGWDAEEVRSALDTASA